MKTRFFSFLILAVTLCLLPVAVLASEVMPQRITLLAEGRPYPEKPITVRCTVMSQGKLPEEWVTIARGAEPKAAEQGQEMKLIKTEPDKRIYEATIDPLPVGEYTFACHVRFASDDHENIRKKFGNLYVTSVDSLSGKNVVDMSTALYVRVKDDQIVTSGLSGVNIEKKELIGNIRKKQKSDLSDEDLLKKNITELEEINGGPLWGNSSTVSPGQLPREGTTTASRPVPRPKVVMPDYIDFGPYPNTKIRPKTSVKLPCTITSEETLPEEQVTIIKEMYDNVVVLEEEIKLTEVKPGQRIYEYVTEPLPPGDYKFKCNVHYVSDDYKRVSSKNAKKNIRVNKRAENQYEIDVIRSIYILVRDDEVIDSGSNFDYMEKYQLIARIQRKKLSDADYYELLKKSIEELEAINGEALPKYKAVGSSRPK